MVLVVRMVLVVPQMAKQIIWWQSSGLSRSLHYILQLCG